MNVKTMEGLAGAGASVSMINIPMNVAKEAERKGDTGKLERALGYAAQIKDKAGEYSEKARQGMKLEAEEAREQEKLRQEKLEQEAMERRKEEPALDLVHISEEGKAAAQPEGQKPSDLGDSPQDLVYDNLGEAAKTVPETGENIDVTA